MLAIEVPGTDSSNEWLVGTILFVAHHIFNLIKEVPRF